MSRVCKVCGHPKRLDIENELYTGGSNNTLSEVSKRYDLTIKNVVYHKDNHMATIVDEAKVILNEESKKSGINRILNDIKKLDIIINKLEDPEVQSQITPRDAIAAMKLKAELLGDIKEDDTPIQIEWMEKIEEDK